MEKDSKTIPILEYRNELKPYQEQYRTAKERFRVIMWHRGSRKTTDLLNYQLEECFLTKGLYWFISPYLNQGVSTVWTDPNTNIFRWIPEEARHLIKINHSEHSITFQNGSVWQLKGADHKDGLRGAKPIGIAVDEYGEIAKRWGSELREAILEPSIRSSGGWIDYAGTPRGMNDFEHIRQLGQDPTQKEWWSSLKTVYDTGIYTEEEYVEIKRNAVNLDFILQEYECQIKDGASTVFKGHSKCCKGRLEEPIAGHTYIFGIDLARTFDRTAIVGFNTHTNQLVYFKTLQNESWEQQKMNIISTLQKYNNAQAVVDATGAGDSFTEQLSLTGASIYPFKISSNFIKRNLIEKMAMYLENEYISYPDIEEIKDELNSFEYEVSGRNNIIYSAPQGKHDDICIAIALACQMLNMTPVPYHPPNREQEVRENMQLDRRTGYFR